jgi:hypothetical protein
MVSGAHVELQNSGNLGIALLGNFVGEAPTDAARESLTRLIAILSRIHGIDPQGTTHFVNPVSGDERDVRTVSGHQDWMATECPGGTFYAELEAIRADAAAMAATDGD